MRQQRCEAGSERARRDWVGDRKMYMALWGVPDIALLAGIFLPPAARTVVWATALFWKGAACLGNAWHCRRTHCFFTGPFFLVMALLVIAHVLDIFSLGGHGRPILGAAIILGTAGLWLATERALSKNRPS